MARTALAALLLATAAMAGFVVGVFALIGLLLGAPTLAVLGTAVLLTYVAAGASRLAGCSWPAIAAFAAVVWLTATLGLFVGASGYSG